MSKRLDLTNQRFGRLRVLGRAENIKGKTAWRCICDCGTQKVIRTAELRRGDTSSCGCLRRENPPNLIDLAGESFGSLTVLKRNGSQGSQAAWLCKCKCGNFVTVRSRDLRSGSIKSCGCYRRLVAKKTATKHGASHTRLYAVWVSMLQRCGNPNNQDYQHYGGRGIEVCQDWLSFEAFKAWAESAGYRKGLSIERVDNDGGYNPENCVWIPLRDQAKNRRTSVKKERGD